MPTTSISTRYRKWRSRKMLFEATGKNRRGSETVSIIHTYRFAWRNREIPKDTLVHLINTGKLNSVEVEVVEGPLKGRRFITDRRALRFI